MAVCLFGGSLSFLVASPHSGGLQGHRQAPAAALRGGSRAEAGSAATWTGLHLPGLLAALAAAACVARRVAATARTRTVRRAAAKAGIEEAAVSRRETVLPVVIAATAGTLGLPEDPAFAEAVDLPDRISTDPYELIGMTNTEDTKADKQEFYMKKNYKADTYQVLKHMKISGSLDKGTPRMEQWNKRIKEEMNDWVALYRRQDAVVGRQSYYSLYSAVNTLASHFTSYGPKFPFPSKRRPRFYELINTTEKYLEKGK
uniref:Uncharacterized protein n=1 Tax=Pyrodinium bahamense TaxID=73915 RepID=A0A6T8YTK5_9DINO